MYLCWRHCFWNIFNKFRKPINTHFSIHSNFWKTLFFKILAHFSQVAGSTKHWEKTSRQKNIQKSDLDFLIANLEYKWRFLAAVSIIMKRIKFCKFFYYNALNSSMQKGITVTMKRIKIQDTNDQIMITLTFKFFGTCSFRRR